MKAFAIVAVLSGVGVMGQGVGTSTNAKSYRAYTPEEKAALSEVQATAIGTDYSTNVEDETPDMYSAYNSFKFAQPNNYAQSNNLGGNLNGIPGSGNSPGFETKTGERYKTWQEDTWKDTKLSGGLNQDAIDSYGNGEGYDRREQHKDITKTTNPSELDSGTTPAWELHGTATTAPADESTRSGTIDYVYDEEDNAKRWATAWAQQHYYPRSDYNEKGLRDSELNKTNVYGVNHYPLDSDSMGLGGDASYRHHHQELHQNGRAHYSHGLFPELHLDETHRYFMDGEAWPRTENEYRYSFKKWGNGYRAGTLVREMNLEGDDDVHQYQFGHYNDSTHGYDYSKKIDRGNQPSLFADAPNGGNQEVYTPLLDYSWTEKKYTALDAHTENTYQDYIDKRSRLNGSDGNPAVRWHFDRKPYFAGSNPKVEITDLSNSESGQKEIDMSVTSKEEALWNMKNSGMWNGNGDWGEKWKGWTNQDGTRMSGAPVLQKTLSELSGDNNGQGASNPHQHKLENFGDVGGYAVGPTGHGLTTAVNDKYGWNTDHTYGYGKLDTYRTWNMKGRKV